MEEELGGKDGDYFGIVHEGYQGVVGQMIFVVD
jgi:hypothetical protein